MAKGGSTSDFFQFLDNQNNAIAAREAEKKQKKEQLGGDRFRLKREAERREQWGGTLRARPRLRSRPVTGRVIRGHMENPE